VVKIDQWDPRFRTPNLPQVLDRQQGLLGVSLRGDPGLLLKKQVGRSAASPKFLVEEVETEEVKGLRRGSLVRVLLEV